MAAQAGVEAAQVHYPQAEGRGGSAILEMRKRRGRVKATVGPSAAVLAFRLRCSMFWAKVR